MLKNLKVQSGLPLSLENGKIVLTEQAVSLPVAYRQLEEAVPYLKDKSADFNSDYLYAMYKGVHLKNDTDLFKKYHLRYDITQISPGLIGKEFVKTIGHYHKDLSSEIYEVLSGEAIFLFQKISSGGEADEIYLIRVGVGQKVIVPSGYGHITINPGKDFLIVTDISFDKMEPDYDFFKNYKGAAYYVLENNNDIATVRNENYSSVGNLRIGKPKEIPELNVYFSKPLYPSFIESPEKFDFITHPENYKKILVPDNLFELENK